jgi:hypothetical protein
MNDKMIEAMSQCEIPHLRKIAYSTLRTARKPKVEVEPTLPSQCS